VLTLGVNPATGNIVQAVTLAAGVAIYTINWPAVRARLRRGRPHRAVA
jgi:ribose transport system permease protein